MARSFVGVRMLCAAAEAAASPVSISRWERLKNSKAGEKIGTGDSQFMALWTQRSKAK